MSEGGSARPTLRRRLGLLPLVTYGLILIQPTAPMPVFGVIYTEARGHVVTAILLALVGMLFTAISYGRMATIYPEGGSAFLYVGRQLNPALGYLCGWCLLLDYILNPLICTIWAGQAMVNFVPFIPYPAWIVIFATAFTLLNVNGVEASSRIHSGFALALSLVLAVIFVAGVRYLSGLQLSAHAFALPFYDAATFSPGRVFHGTSIAVLTYIGFDGISTLADEAIAPSRSVPRAILITCALTGLLAAAEVYLAQLCWPARLAFPNIDTAYVYVTGRVGGRGLFVATNAALLLATVGSGVASQLGAARILLSMSQRGALPRRFFAVVSPGNSVPANNVWFVGILCLVGGLLMSYQTGAELLNFGALLAFIGVNLAAAHHAFHARPRAWAFVATAIAGALVCTFLWINLGRTAIAAGLLWASTGIFAWLVRRLKPHAPGERLV